MLDIELYNNEIEVDGQKNFNKIKISYPFATRPSCDQFEALQLINKIVAKFEGKATYNETPFTLEKAQSDWDNCNDFLLKEWGEEPGSKTLRIMIGENYA